MQPTWIDKKKISQQDSLQGYKSQNKFLNKEILELSALRRNAERRERDLMAKVSQDRHIVPLEGRVETMLEQMCFQTYPATMMGDTWLLVSERVKNV